MHSDATASQLASGMPHSWPLWTLADEQPHLRRQYRQPERRDVPITLARRFAWTCEHAGQHSVQPGVDNCYRDQAVTNARQLADLLTSADTSVVSPSG
jgi:hypothetical protein